MTDLKEFMEEHGTGFVRRPFVVSAVPVTIENIHELSEFMGNLVSPDDENVLPYILCDPKKVRNRSKVRVGMWMTVNEFGVIHCYGDGPMRNQFKEATSDIMLWVGYMKPKEED